MSRATQRQKVASRAYLAECAVEYYDSEVRFHDAKASAMRKLRDLAKKRWERAQASLSRIDADGAQ